LVIATSRYGSPLTEIAEKLAEKWEKANSVLVAFGAPSQGLADIIRREGFSLSDVADFVVNTIPMQGTETVRTEEALLASLGSIRCVLET
jgi:hypothetical protein